MWGRKNALRNQATLAGVKGWILLLVAVASARIFVALFPDDVEDALVVVAEVADVHASTYGIRSLRQKIQAEYADLEAVGLSSTPPCDLKFSLVSAGQL